MKSEGGTAIIILVYYALSFDGKGIEKDMKLKRKVICLFAALCIVAAVAAREVFPKEVREELHEELEEMKEHGHHIEEKLEEKKERKDEE